ncbi:MAG: class I tRNA ligase family protein, partial [Syntrophales bacterium]|nr:class I tRNA ligase family protein [Syntrophales bacterium]
MARGTLSATFDPHVSEQRWYAYWMENNFFHAEDVSDRKPFCIVIPPPNVTGMLHMGHALNNTCLLYTS